MSSWKTTVAGIGSLLTGVAIILSGLGGDTQPDYTAAGAAIMAGVGLLFARDNDKTSASAGAK